jgi:hypothetical protein
VDPHERLRKDRRHPLDGYMHVSTPDSIENALMYYPPTGEQLIELGLQEMAGQDRPLVYRILAAYKPRAA